MYVEMLPGFLLFLCPAGVVRPFLPSIRLAPEASENKTLRYICQARRRLQSWHRRSARAEYLTQQRLWFCEPPDSPDNSEYALSTNESDEDDFDYGAPINRADQRNQLSHTSSSTTTQSQANGSWSQGDHIRAGHWQHYGWGHSQHLEATGCPSEYHNWR